MASYLVGLVCKFVKISYRQAQYWRRTHFIEPSVARGRSMEYSFADIILLLAAKRLRSKSLSIQAIRKIIAMMKERMSDLPFSLEESVILINKNRLYFSDGSIYGSDEDMVKINCRAIRQKLKAMSRMPVEASL